MDSLPQDLLSLLASLLVPRLALPDLQALHQTCCSFRRLVQAASPRQWQAAAAAHGLRPGSLTAASSYCTAAKLAAHHAAISTGPSSIHTVSGCNESDCPGQGTVDECALHPNFAVGLRAEAMGSSSPSMVLCSSGTHTRAAKRQHSACMPSHRLSTEDSCAQDGAHVVLHMRHCCPEMEAGTPSLCLYRLQAPVSSHMHLPLQGRPIDVVWAPDSRSFAVLSQAAADH